MVVLGNCGEAPPLEEPSEPVVREEANHTLDAWIGSSLRRQPIKINPEVVIRSIRDAIAGQSEMNDADVVGILQR